MKYVVKPTKLKELAFCNCACNGGNCNCKDTAGGSYDDSNTATVYNS